MKYSTSVLLIILTVTVTSCGKDKKEWDKIKTSASLQEMENFISRFPKSQYFDSILLLMESNIYEQSEKSITRSGTFEDYQSYLNNYPRLAELTNAREKLENLILKADTIEISGYLVDNKDNPVPRRTVMAWPVNDKGKAVLHISEGGILANPRDISDSTGSFHIKGHRSFLLEFNEFVLDVNGTYLFSDEGAPVTFATDTNNRVIDVGKIILK